MAESSSGPVRIGIVGLGRAGWDMHRPELKGKEQMFKVVAVCDPIKDRLDKAAAEWGCKTYTKVGRLIADPNVELVDIANRSMDHYRDSMRALKAGKHVFVEKPMCLTYAEARRLEAASEKGPGKLFVRHNRRFDRDFLHVREIIQSGILGEVYHVKLSRLSYSRRNDWQTLLEHGGGQLLNWGPHVIDHALRLLESPVESMWSDLRRIAAAGDAEDYVRIILRGATDRVVEIEISGGSALSAVPVYVAWGTKGALSCDCSEITLRYLDPNKEIPPRQADPGTPTGGYGSPDDLAWVEQKIPVAPQKTCEIWAALYGAVRKGAEFPIRLDEAVEVMRVISAAKKGTPFEFKRRK